MTNLTIKKPDKKAFFRKSFFTFLFLMLAIFNLGMAQTLFISEVTDPLTYAGRYVELYNASGSDINFDSEIWFLSKQTNGGATWTNVQLTGTIANGATYVIGGTTFEAQFGFAPNLVNAIISGNGDDGYFLYSGGNNTSGTLVDAYGVINVDGTGQTWEYTDSKAVRNSNIITANSSWTAPEWTITAADVADCNPGEHTVNGTTPTEFRYFASDMNSWGAEAMTKRTLGTPSWIISLLYTGENGTKAFKFRESSENWTNSWGRGDVVNQNEVTTWYFGGTNGSMNHVQNMYYSYILKDVAVSENSEGYVFATSAAPLTFMAVLQLPASGVTYADNVEVTVTASAAPCAEEKVYLRYTTDAWATSTLVPVTFTGTTGTATIPAVSGATVSYYIFSTTIVNPNPASVNIDLLTLNYIANNGTNYSYTTTVPPVEVATIAALRASTVGTTVYKLTGEAFLTFQQTYRNQKFIQDATGGILVDDNTAKITTTYNLGDGITGITVL